MNGTCPRTFTLCRLLNIGLSTRPGPRLNHVNVNHVNVTNTSKIRARYSAISAACSTCVTSKKPYQQARSICVQLSQTNNTRNRNRLCGLEKGSIALLFNSKNLRGSECCRQFTQSVNGSMDSLTFETMVEDILESLLDFFEQLGDEENMHTDFDVTYSSGVLTVHFGPNHGTYVINKQTPNKQIWLSSPTSGPKRYDFNGNDWVYTHDGVPMLDLLSEEISRIIGKSVNLYKVIKLKET